MLNRLFEKMCAWDAGDPHRIHHFTKVHAFAKYIAEEEGGDKDMLFLIETAAYVHDIGIKLAKEKYGTSAGPYQEKEGAPAARAMLSELGFEEALIDRVSYLVGHHHTYTNIDGIDYQILVEADFLVNIHEHGDAPETMAKTVEKIFRTEAGTRLAKIMYGLQ